MTAALRKGLILELDGARPRTLEQAHGSADIERIAITVIGIDDEMRGNAVADHADDIDHLAHTHEPDVGAAKPRIGDRCAGDIERRKTGLFGEMPSERIVHAGRDDDGLTHEARAQGFRMNYGHSPR